MNTAHNGVCLGQVLYKVCNHLQIVPKVGVNTFQLTLLNMLFIRLATSLVTMPRTTTQCFKSLHTAISSRQVPLSMWNTTTLGLPQAFDFMWCTHAFSFRCLAHIINLATQAVITTCSKAKYYNSSSQDDNKLPQDLGVTEHNEIGIVHANCIKVHHSWFQSHRICQGLAGPWYAWRECEAVCARVSGSRVWGFRWGRKPKLERRREGNNGLQEIDKDKTGVWL